MLVDVEGHRFLLHLNPTGEFHSSHGFLRHSAIIGRPDGDRLYTNLGKPMLCLRPTLEEYVLKMKRRSQIIYPKDIGAILLKGDIGPGATVLEIGVGAGALAIAILQALAGSGRLVSYEAREDMAALAAKNIDAFLGPTPNHEVLIRDAYEGIDHRDLDTLIIDLAEPWRLVAEAADALRSGGTLLCWLPGANQVYEATNALRAEPRFDLVEVVETLARPWHIGARSLRPEHRMVAHTGFLVSARRCAERPEPAAEPIEEASGDD